MTRALGSAEFERERPARPRKLPKKLKNARKVPKAVAPASTATESWWDDSWHWLGLGLAGVVTPFSFAALTLPGWTGQLGSWLAGGLYESFGLSALLLPGVTGCISLHLLLPRQRRPLQLSWAPTLLWLDLIWLSQRMGGQGGLVGALFDGAVVSLVGPMGSWMAAGLGLAATGLAVCRIPLSRVVRALAQRFADGVERSCQWLGSIRIPERPPQYVSGENEQAALPASPGEAVPLPATFTPEPVPAQTPPVEPAARKLRVVEPNRSVAEPAPVPTRPPAVASAPVPPESVELEPEAEAELPEEPELAREMPENESQDDFPGGEPEVLWAHEPPPAELPDLEELGVAAPEETVVDGQLACAEELAADEKTMAEEPAAPELEPEAAAPPPRPETELLIDSDGQLRLFPSAEKKPVPKYQLPSLSLLQETPLSHQRPRVEDKSQVLLDSLASFGVQASLLQIVQGPTVTRYELQPARGVKVSRFTSLTNDIALALAAKAVRIEAPIPGKSAIGIEIPNQETELVTLRDILGSPRFKKSQGMSIALGKDLQGTPTFANLQKMPHLLVAGTTGSGKSVCINALIMSLLYRFTPRELQLLMIDPKQVELSIYEGIPHLISLAKNVGDGRDTGAIICDPKRAAMALHQIVELMEYRYGLFAAARVRNLDEYNQAGPEPLPWVVVIIDELADLMMVASKSVETSICRIAQKARAAGIHLVLATQRPSADVITGLIKVNVPSRIAFAVSSQVDSRVILDSGGAEQLLGKGDMLFCPVDASDPRRLQGCFVTNEEILRVVEWWRAQACPENLIRLQVTDVVEEAADEEEGSDDDALVEQALQVVLRRQQASASLLQTELKVGYARARRLIYLMEKKGYIGPAEGSKPRKILYGSA